MVYLKPADSLPWRWEQALLARPDALWRLRQARTLVDLFGRAGAQSVPRRSRGQQDRKRTRREDQKLEITRAYIDGLEEAAGRSGRRTFKIKTTSNDNAARRQLPTFAPACLLRAIMESIARHSGSGFHGERGDDKSRPWLASICAKRKGQPHWMRRDFPDEWEEARATRRTSTCECPHTLRSQMVA